MRVCSLVEGVRVSWVPWDEVVVILMVAVGLGMCMRNYRE